MRNQDKRRAVRVKVGVESLDERIVPSAATSIRAQAAQAARLNTGGAGRAERLAQRREALADRLEARRAQQAQRLAGRPAVANRLAAGLNRSTAPTAITVQPPAQVVSQVVAQPPSAQPVAGTGVVTVTPPIAPTDNPADVKNGPLAKAGQDLIGVYLDGQDGQISPALASLIRIEGNAVGVDVRGVDTAALSSFLTGLGMRVENVDAATGTVEGVLPIAALPAVASSPLVTGLTPIYRPALRAPSPVIAQDTAVTPPIAPTDNPADVKNGPLAKAGQDLIGVYLDGQDGQISPALASLIRIEGNAVGVDVRGVDTAALSSFLTGLGMRVENIDAATGTVEGVLPIAALPAVAGSPLVTGLTPIYREKLN